MSFDRQNLKIYLSGKMAGLNSKEMSKWRYDAEKILNDRFNCTGSRALFYIFNPVRYYNYENHEHQSEKEIKNFEIKHVITSDIIIVNLDGLNTSDGSKYEIIMASQNNIPIIAFGDKELYDELHPWIRDDITRVEDDMDSVVTYISNFYMR